MAVPPARLSGGLESLVMAPLKSESRVFGVLGTARVRFRLISNEWRLMEREIYQVFCAAFGASPPVQLLTPLTGLAAANAYAASAPLAQTRERLFGLLREMAEEERLPLDERIPAELRTRQTVVATGALVALALIALLSATYFLIRRQFSELKRAQQVFREQNELLERRVRARTAELETANQKLHGEITGRKQAERELQHKTELMQLLEQLARAANEAVSPEAAMETCLRRICEDGNWVLGRIAAFRSKRPYKPPFAHYKSLEIILKGDGRTMPEHFDPAALDAFEKNADRFNEIWDEYADK